MNKIIKYLERNGLKDIKLIEDKGNVLLFEVQKDKDILEVEIEGEKVIIKMYVPKMDKFITVLTDRIY